tara:strand:- start:32 stop:814 length:783 start_codon:yes stop_codon:yes gene_type:complete
MATLNELIAALNAKSDSMLANAAKLNTTADNMNQTLDGILGVEEVQPLDRDQTESFTTTNVVDGPQTEVGLTGTGEPIMGTDIPAPRNFLSDTVDAVKDYIQGGGMIGIVARGIGSLLPERDPRQTALDNFYGSVSNGTIQSGLMAGYNPVSGGALNFLTGGRLGEPTNYGLQRAYQKRIDTRTDPKTLARIANLSQERQDAFAQKTKDLQRAKIEESMMLDRVNRDTAYRDDIGDSYSGSYDVRDDTSYSDPFDLGGGE